MVIVLTFVNSFFVFACVRPHKRGGAKTDEEVEAEESRAFGGSGYRLGNTNTEGPARPAVQPKQQDRLKIVVSFWRQGFSVGDGPLRPYNDPNNARFLQDVEEGYVPRELEAEAAGRELVTELVDRKTEDFKEPEKPRYNAFGGSGHSLGSTSSSSTSTSVPVPTKATTPFNLDPNSPTISVQVRFHDGTKATAKLNTSHTVLDLRAWIEANKPTSGLYDLLAGFPPKPLTDTSQNVVSAGLSGAAVTQKLR
jgi:UBX domain-containing protein 1